MKGLTVYVLTIFPGLFENFLNYGIVKRAIEKCLVNITVVNIRNVAYDKHKTVDDTPYGGGAGMVMKPDILAASLKSTLPFRENRQPRVIFFDTPGETL